MQMACRAACKERGVPRQARACHATSPSAPGTCCLLAQVAAAQAQRQRIRDHLLALLGADGVLALPSTPGPAPLLGTPAAVLDEWRTRLISLTSIAGLAGLPQVRASPCTMRHRAAAIAGVASGWDVFGPAAGAQDVRQRGSALGALWGSA